MLHTDSDIINGLKAGAEERLQYEKILFQQYYYFTHDGARKCNLSFDNSFSAYSDAILAVIHNIVNNKFDGRSSIKTYLYQIFSNNCINFIRKATTNKSWVHTIIPDPPIRLTDYKQDLIDKVFGKPSSEPADPVLLGASTSSSCAPENSLQPVSLLISNQ